MSDPAAAIDPSELVDPSDAMAIGYKVVEMAERLILMNKFRPGAKASWAFDMDGLRFDVAVTASATEAGNG